MKQGKTSTTGVPMEARSRKTADRSHDGSHPLDSDQAQERLKRLVQWRRQSRIAHGPNRSQQATDEDFYDGIQLSEEDLQTLNDREQPPLVYNVTKNTVNWILGTERKSRIDYRVLPRAKDDVSGAKTKTKMLKYVQDTSRGEYVRSQAFADSVKSGVGWIETGARADTDDEPLFMRAENWRNMWFDHLGREPDCSDWRYVIREKWCDLDIAQAMFPERADSLALLSTGVNSLYPFLPEDSVLQDNASEFDMETEMDSFLGGAYSARERVKLIEMWYRIPAKVKVIKAPGVIDMHQSEGGVWLPGVGPNPYGARHGAIYRPDDPEHRYLVRGGYATTFDSVRMVVRCAIWSGGTYLQDIMSPYNHNRLPFTPIFCYRRSRDGMPYGVIRDLRDPQSDLNKRRSKSLFLLSSNRMVYEKGALDNPAAAYAEFNRSDGMVEVKEGALSGKKVEIIKEAQLAAQHVELARDDERFMQSISGVTDENLGKKTNAISGKAIEARQNQGFTTSGVVFDNYYASFQMVGEVLLSLIEQYKDQAAVVRITGEQQKDEFMEINTPHPETGEIQNAITRSKADFIVGKQDYRESMRLAMFETVSELVQNLAGSMPQVALNLLDMVVDFMDDLPGKDEMVARIRKINGQRGPDEELTDEERQQIQMKEQQEQEAGMKAQALQEAMLQLEMRLKEALVKEKEAGVQGKQTKALLDSIAASVKRVEGYTMAMEAASMVQAAPHLAEAADAIIDDSDAIGTEHLPTVQEETNGSQETEQPVI